MSTPKSVTVGPTGVTPEDVVAVARGSAAVELSEEAVEAMAASRSIVDAIDREERPVYGVSTGFGALANTFVASGRRAELQHASALRAAGAARANGGGRASVCPGLPCTGFRLAERACQ